MTKKDREDEIMRIWERTGSMAAAVRSYGYPSMADVPVADMERLWERAWEDASPSRHAALPQSAEELLGAIKALARLRRTMGSIDALGALEGHAEEYRAQLAALDPPVRTLTPRDVLAMVEAGEEGDIRDSAWRQRLLPTECQHSITTKTAKGQTVMARAFKAAGGIEIVLHINSKPDTETETVIADSISYLAGRLR